MINYVRNISIFLVTICFIILTTKQTQAGAKRKAINLNFHLESFNQVPTHDSFPHEISGATVYFLKKPLITKEHIEWYYPFKTGNKDDYGATFKINETATQSLIQGSFKFNNLYVLPLASTGAEKKPYPQLVFDNISDPGLITIWSGISKEDLKILNLRFKKFKVPYKFKKRKKPNRSKKPRTIPKNNDGLPTH